MRNIDQMAIGKTRLTLRNAVYSSLKSSRSKYFNQLLIFGNQTRNHCYLPHEVISFQLHCMPFPYYYALSLNIIHMTQFLVISKRLTFDVICLDFVKIR